MARLVGVSPAAVVQWEQGRATPAGKNRAALVGLRRLGRRQAKRLLASAAAGRAKPRRPAALAGPGPCPSSPRAATLAPRGPSGASDPAPRAPAAVSDGRSLTFTGRLRSIRSAVHGVAVVLRTQRNAWIHVPQPWRSVRPGSFSVSRASEWCWIVLAIVAVWTAEALNTAFELLTDLASPGYHPLAGRAKDVAAGAVLISAIGSMAIGALIFGPRMLSIWPGEPTPRGGFRDASDPRPRVRRSRGHASSRRCPRPSPARARRWSGSRRPGSTSSTSTTAPGSTRASCRFPSASRARASSRRWGPGSTDGARRRPGRLDGRAGLLRDPQRGAGRPAGRAARRRGLRAPGAAAMLQGMTAHYLAHSTYPSEARGRLPGPRGGGRRRPAPLPDGQARGRPRHRARSPPRRRRSWPARRAPTR